MKTSAFILPLFLLTTVVGLGQTVEPFRIDSLPTQGVLLDKGWKWHAGDNPEWAKTGFDDRTWERIDPTKDIMELPQVRTAGMGWFRLQLRVDSSLHQEQLVLTVEQLGASEIFLNGRLLYRFGRVSADPKQIQTHNPLGQPLVLPLSDDPEQVLAVRFAFNNDLPYLRFANRPNPLLQVRIDKTNQQTAEVKITPLRIHDFSNIGFFLSLSILHLALFWFNTKQKANLYLLVFSFATLINDGIYIYSYQTHRVEERVYIHVVIPILFAISLIFVLTTIYSLLQQRRGIMYWFLITLYLIYIPLYSQMYESGTVLGEFYLALVYYAECCRVSILAVRQRKRGAWLIAGGGLIYLISTFCLILILNGVLPNGPGWVFLIGAFEISHLAFPVSLSLFLALEFAFTSQSLAAKLVQVQQLSDQTVAQEQEKREILATQNERLERQVAERTAELKNSLEHLKATQTQLIQKEKMASLGELTAGIAHEIQNPLNFVNNFSEVSTELVEELREEHRKPERDPALEEELLDDLTQNLQKITHHGGRVSSIVKGMLEHSRTSTGERQLTDLNALADEYLRLAYQGLRAKDKSFNVQLVTDFDPKPGLVEIVPPDIGRVLLNLFNNAFYAVSEREKQGVEGYQPTVSVSTKRVEDGVEIRVSDNGMGMPDSVKQKIFQPFFTTKPTGSGTGLGLSLSHDIVVKGHGGTLNVESQEGTFTEFIIQLSA